MVDAKAESNLVKEPLETAYVKFTIEDGILCGMYVNNLHLNLAMATQIVNDRLQYTNNADMYCFADIRGVRSATRDARQHLAIEGSNHIIACAILVDSLLSKTLGNIFLTINKPLSPMRMFTSKEEAMKWLKQKQYNDKRYL